MFDLGGVWVFEGAWSVSVTSSGYSVDTKRFIFLFAVRIWAARVSSYALAVRLSIMASFQFLLGLSLWTRTTSPTLMVGETFLARNLAFLKTGQIVLLPTGPERLKNYMVNAKHVERWEGFSPKVGSSSPSSTAGWCKSGVRRSSYSRWDGVRAWG
jgi:hypothetical protein